MSTPSQFRNSDAPARAQVAAIRWERILQDDDSSDRPDERDDGFWPSRDPAAAGYVLPENFDAQHALASERMEAFDAGDWNYVGVIARAHISLPIGGGSFVTYTLDSPGIWGVESDAADSLEDLLEDQKAELLGHLAELATALPSFALSKHGFQAVRRDPDGAEHVLGVTMVTDSRPAARAYANAESVCETYRAQLNRSGTAFFVREVGAE